MRRKSILLSVVIISAMLILLVSDNALAGYLYGVGPVSSNPDLGIVRINPTDMSYDYFSDTGALRSSTGLAYVPEPATLLLLGLGGLALRKKRRA
jgi:hypothetical protein